MKIDRLLSIIILLLNRDIVSAKKLAERFGVSVRTIQRDMESIDLAGIPIISIQGPNGGYGIMDTYKLDRRLLSLDDFYNIITALSGISESLEDEKMSTTLEKVRGLLPDRSSEVFRGRDEKLHIDFSMLGGGPMQRDIFKVVQKAVESERLLRFSYVNNRLEQVIRVVEPMTIVFKWRSWYLYGYCRLKEDYRIFRTSRIRDPEILTSGFRRRERSFEDFFSETGSGGTGREVDLVLRFDPIMKSMVEEFYNDEDRTDNPDGSVTVRARMPEDGWVYGYILSYGSYVEVLEPKRIRDIIRDTAEQIRRFYE